MRYISGCDEEDNSMKDWGYANGSTKGDPPLSGQGMFKRNTFHLT